LVQQVEAVAERFRLGFEMRLPLPPDTSERNSGRRQTLIGIIGAQLQPEFGP
jgi:hypothetical protein